MSKTDEVMLAVTYDSDKVKLPAEVSIKLDGVAADFYRTPNGWVAQTRQGKPIGSVAHILAVLNSLKEWPAVNTHIVGELTVVGVPTFKDASGIIRRSVTDARIVLNVYDMYNTDYPEEVYATRIGRMETLFAGTRYTHCADNVVWEVIRRVPVMEVCHTVQEIDQHIKSTEYMMSQSPSFEGLMIRCIYGADSMYQIGKRSKNMMRYKPKPTVDLLVHSFEEATANKRMKFLGEWYEEGQGLGAVGRINCYYHDEVIGVGPGTLSHKERRELWQRYQRAKSENGLQFFEGVIAEVEYMLDESYDALRQPIFKQWRIDKEEPSEVA